VFEDKNGLRRKDCSACSLNHDGYRASWAFIQKWLEQPVIWNGHEQSPRYLPKAPSRKRPRDRRARRRRRALRNHLHPAAARGGGRSVCIAAGFPARAEPNEPGAAP